MRPATRYATTAGGQIAYQTLGDGPIDLLFVQGFGSNIELFWDYRPAARFFERLASFSRVILFDRRGTGASDPVAAEALGTWEEHIGDYRVVMDAVGAESPAVLACGDAGAVALMLSASEPSRTRALILWNSYARILADESYPIGLDGPARNAMLDYMESEWGTEQFATALVPSYSVDPVGARWLARMLRTSATPAAVTAQAAAIESLDARPVLSSVQVPTLVMSRTNFALFGPEHGRYIADNVDGARYLDVAGGDFAIWGEGADATADIVEEFLTGSRPVSRFDRVLATVLFTDIVGSTERASQLGDQRWKHLLAMHDRLSQATIDDSGGRFVKTTGDGLLATFDLPGRAIHCAFELSRALEGIGLTIRAGLHAGEVEFGENDDIGGIAVHIGARVMEASSAGQVVCTRTVRELTTGSGFTFHLLGSQNLRGLPDNWDIFSITDR